MSIYHNESLEILKILIETGESYSIRKLSQTRKINYKSAYNAIMKLEKQGVVTIERLGNTNMCSFSRNFNQSVFAAEDERRNNLMKNKDFAVIHKRLSELHFPLIALVFGSHARRMAGVHSDIDLLVVTENEKEIRNVISLVPLNIHLTTITPKELISMARSREFTVVSEAIKRNVILIGIEEYYRLLQNVG